jgi:hypothetical protein
VPILLAQWRSEQERENYTLGIVEGNGNINVDRGGGIGRGYQ